MKYTITRGGVTILEHEFKGYRQKSAPAVDFVEIEFDYFEAFIFKSGDAIVFDGQTYYCDKQYNNVFKKSSNLYTHRARFLSETYRATEIALLDPNGVSSFEIEGNLLTLLTLAVDNLNRVSYGWSFNPPPTTVTKTFDISGENVMSFLTKLSGEFEIPFEINNVVIGGINTKVISFQQPVQPVKGSFAYGKGNGFLDLRRLYRTTDKVPNTVYATGGDGLQLENPVTNASDIAENGVIEGFYSNEDIKPTTRTQMVGTTSFNNVVVTDLINYDLNAYRIPGVTPIINFETGALGGLSFYITQFDYDSGTNVSLIYIKERTVDGDLLPDATRRPQHGDYFNITNITQPQEVVDEALQKLELYAETFMDNGINKNIVLQANLDPLYSEDLKVNDRIIIFDADLDIDGTYVINDIKTDLQNLNKKDLTIDFVGKFSFQIGGNLNVKLTPKNDNIIDLGIANNHDDLVQVEEEVKVVSDELVITNEKLVIAEGKIFEIDVVKLPLKESISNKVGNLDGDSPNQFPNVPAVKLGLTNAINSANSYTDNVALGKQDTLVAGNNVTINPVTNEISSENTTYSSGGGITQTGTVFSMPVTTVGSGNYISNVVQNANGITVTKDTLPALMDGTRLTFRPTNAPYTVGSFPTKKTIINYATGVVGANLTVSDAPYDGYELAINGCGEIGVTVYGNLRNLCGTHAPFAITTASLFWWSETDNIWYQVM